MMRWLPKFDPRGGMRTILIVQLGLAGLLIANELIRDLPTVFRKPVELPVGPVSPGDQRREYRTDRPNPGLLTVDEPSDIPLPDEFSDRLNFSQLSVDGIGEVVLLSGGIEVGDAERFKNYLDTLSTVPQVVALHSPGGIVAEAKEIGRLIRERDLQTGVFSNAFCLSSCPYILAAGTERTVSLRSVVGLHQHYCEQSKLLPVVFAVEDIQVSQGETMEYLIEMGVDPSLMVYSLRTPPEEIYALVEEELIATRIATQIIK